MADSQCQALPRYAQYFVLIGSHVVIGEARTARDSEPICRSPVGSMSQVWPGSCGGSCEGEECKGDEGSGAVEPERDSVSSRILVLDDSMSPWDRPCSRLASMAARCLVSFFGEFNERGEPVSTGPGQPAVEGAFAFGSFDVN